MLCQRRPSWLNSVYRTRLCSYSTFPLPECVTFTFDHADVVTCSHQYVPSPPLPARLPSCTPPFLQTPLRDPQGGIGAGTSTVDL